MKHEAHNAKLRLYTKELALELANAILDDLEGFPEEIQGGVVATGELHMTWEPRAALEHLMQRLMNEVAEDRLRGKAEGPA